MTDPTARQRLLDAMRNRTCFCGADSCHNADEYVDAYAHELAEQQRADAQARHDRSYSDNRIFELKGAQNAADLIDPKAQP